MENDGKMEGRKPFGKIRQMLFPIYLDEFWQMLAMITIFLFTSLNYSLLRSLKDLYVYKFMSAETIYCIKVFVVPSILLFTIINARISRKVDEYAIFNVIFSYFIVFLVVFSVVLLPNCDALKLNYIADFLHAKLPRFSAWWDVIRVWPVSLLYIHAEAFGTMCLSVAFWTFANLTFTDEQAKRTYSFLSLGAATGTIISGSLLKYFSESGPTLLKISISSLVFILVVYNTLLRYIKRNPERFHVEVKTKRQKVKLGFVESIKHIAKSKYLCYLTCIVLGYNMCIALWESIWKGQIKLYRDFVIKSFMMSAPECTKEMAENVGMSSTSSIYGYQGILTGLFQYLFIFFVANVVQKKSWKMKAMTTPVLALVLFGSFFFFNRNKEFLQFFADTYGKDLNFVFLFFGMITIVTIKTCKYALFDVTKEFAFKVLPVEIMMIAKAAIDTLISRFGKGGAAFLISGVLTPLCGSLPQATDVISILIYIVLTMWIWAVIKLSPLYEEKLKEREKMKKEMNKEAENANNSDTVYKEKKTKE